MLMAAMTLGLQVNFASAEFMLGLDSERHTPLWSETDEADSDLLDDVDDVPQTVVLHECGYCGVAGNSASGTCSSCGAPMKGAKEIIAAKPAMFQPKEPKTMVGTGKLIKYLKDTRIVSVDFDDDAAVAMISEYPVITSVQARLLRAIIDKQVSSSSVGMNLFMACRVVLDNPHMSSLHASVLMPMIAKAPDFDSNIYEEFQYDEVFARTAECNDMPSEKSTRLLKVFKIVMDGDAEGRAARDRFFELLEQ